MHLSFVVCMAVMGADLFGMGEAYSKSDESIVGKIKEKWGANIPKNLITQAKANGKELVIITTPNYYSAGTKCVYSVFTDNQLVLTRVPTEGAPSTTNIDIKENGGIMVTETNDAVVLRYHVFLDNGVTAVYTCNTKGEDSDKTPDGMIKVKAGQVDQTALDAAKNALKDVGVTGATQPLCQDELKAAAGK